ncbi:hypothetical protein NDU88_000910 [Pleurodeles waltl]|uniref:Uncharacterized protein n=1 Tax=Pleurodeles waltl TaxID=8319 RepID=A0AAV7TGB1_PLEWA|nr:hypothetical protein NDU88_000910 [Pleurodeles waltl]
MKRSALRATAGHYFGKDSSMQPMWTAERVVHHVRCWCIANRVEASSEALAPLIPIHLVCIASEVEASSEPHAMLGPFIVHGGPCYCWATTVAQESQARKKPQRRLFDPSGLPSPLLGSGTGGKTSTEVPRSS